MIKKIR